MISMNELLCSFLRLLAQLVLFIIIILINIIVIIIITSNNQRLESAFDYLEPRLAFLCKLVMMSSAPAKSAGDTRYASYKDQFIR